MKFRAATTTEYVEWLKGYLANGGRITHYYDRPFPAERFLYAVQSFVLADERGSVAREIIVPKGIRFSGDLGHNRLYIMKGFEAIGHSVPVFGDREFHDLPGYQEAVEESNERSRRFRERIAAQQAERAAWKSGSDLGEME